MGFWTGGVVGGGRRVVSGGWTVGVGGGRVISGGRTVVGGGGGGVVGKGQIGSLILPQVL